MNITDVKVFPVNEEKLKAFVSIIFDDCFVVTDIKVINGNNGLFVSMPSKKRKNGTFRDVAHPLNNETRRMIEERIFEEYHKVLKAKEPTQTAEAPVADTMAASASPMPVARPVDAPAPQPAALLTPAGPSPTSEPEPAPQPSPSPAPAAPAPATQPTQPEPTPAAAQPPASEPQAEAAPSNQTDAPVSEEAQHAAPTTGTQQPPADQGTESQEKGSA